VSPCRYVRVRILLYVCLSVMNMCSILLYICPHTTTYVSAYCYICVLIGDVEGLLLCILLVLGVQEAAMTDAEVVGVGSVVRMRGGGLTLLRGGGGGG
jgi:hypothetical protein